MEIFIVVALGALLLFMVFNTRKKQRLQQENLATNLVPGARVMTTFGLFGTVVSINEDENQVVIESSPGTVLTLHKQAIGRVEPAESDVPVVDVPDDASSLEESSDKSYGDRIDEEDDLDARLREGAEARDADTHDSYSTETGADDLGARDTAADADVSVEGDDTVADRDLNDRDLNDGPQAPGESSSLEESRDVDEVWVDDAADESSLESVEPQGPPNDDANVEGDDRPTKA